MFADCNAAVSSLLPLNIQPSFFRLVGSILSVCSVGLWCFAFSNHTKDRHLANTYFSTILLFSVHK